MKSFFAGLLAIALIGVALFAIRGDGLIPSKSSSPSPSASTPSNWDMAPESSASPTPKPSSSPSPSVAPATKGEVKGTSTTKTVKKTTTTTKVTSITVLESKDCQLNATSYVRNISSPLTIKYSLKDNYSAKVTIWKTNGETVLNQTLIKGSGVLKEIDTRDDLKFQVVSDACEETSDTWLKLTAEK